MGETNTHHGGDQHSSWGRPTLIMGEANTHHGGDQHSSWGRPTLIMGEANTHHGGDQHSSWGRPTLIMGETNTHHGGDQHSSWGRPTLIMGETNTRHGGEIGKQARGLVQRDESGDYYSVMQNPLSPKFQNIWDRFLEKGPSACFFKISHFYNMYKPDLSSTHCFLRTVNQTTVSVVRH